MNPRVTEDEISATIDDNDVGEIEVFDIGDVDASADTVNFNHENHDDDEEHDGKDYRPLHIDIRQSPSANIGRNCYDDKSQE